jgi:uncharacterized protein YyaL (SSP411 family)
MHYLTRLLKDKFNIPTANVQSQEVHLKAAANWLLRAQQATIDDGISHSYDIRKKKWLASYPETTGYAIATLYDYARYYQEPQCAEAATRMAIWESQIQLKDGGVMAGTIDAEIIAPTIFNTGQVLFGWARAWQETGDERFRSSLQRAADWLVDAQDADGNWRRFPSPFTTAKSNSYNTRTAFALVRAFEVIQDQRYLDAAIANVDWTLSRAKENGWLPDNCLWSDNHRALTHTVAYSIRGILEVGSAVANQQFIEHALRMAQAITKSQRDDGALPGYYTPNWDGAASWSCVTGNSQMAINWLRLAQLTGQQSLKSHALKANHFNMRIQDLETNDLNIHGAVKGSHPINGSYMSYRYPNWACKFFMDGLMLEQLFDRIQHIG